MKDRIESYCDLEWYFNELYNILSEFYWEEYLEDYMTYDLAEERAKYELENWWLARLYYFMGDVNWATANLIKLDWYWNCEEATADDLINVINDIIDNYWADADIYEN